MRKPRSDAKLLNLPEEQQDRLIEWLRSGLPLHRVKTLVREDLGISTGTTALSRYWEQVIAPIMIVQRQQSARVADQVAEEARRQPGRFDEATIEALKQKAFELSVSTGADPRDVKQLFLLVLKARDQELQERQVEVAERRVRAVEAKLEEARRAVEAARGGQVDPARLADEIDRILGRKSGGRK